MGCGGQPLERTPEELLRLGWRDFRLGEYELAVAQFTEARQFAEPVAPIYLAATYALATTWNLRQPIMSQDDEHARRLYREVIERAPQHDLAAWCWLGLARMKHLVPVGEDPDYDAVRSAYQQVIDRFPHHLAGEEAFMYQQSTYVMTLKRADAERAVRELERFVRERPDSEYVSLGYTLLSNAYKTLARPQKRLAAELRAFETLEVDPTSPFQDHAWRYWQIATVAEFEAGDFRTARRFYRKLIEEYPTDIRKYAATQALERMDELEQRLRAELESARAFQEGYPL